MKINFKFVLFGLVAALFAFAPLQALAQAADPVLSPPPGFDWVKPVLEFLQKIPKVGELIVNILKYLGAAAVIFTVLSVAVQSILKVPEIAARFAGAPVLADKIAAFTAKIKPFLDYLSIFNSKKTA